MSGRLDRRLLGALGITMAACAIYAFRLGTPSLRGDEAFTAIMSQWDMASILQALRATEPHPPLYYGLMHYWIALFGKSELALRYPSYVAGVLVIPLTYALGKHCLSRQAGLWGAALAALSPFLIWHGQDARMYSILAALGVASFWLGLRLLSDERTHSYGLWAAYVVVSLAALATHYYALFLLIAENLYFALSWYRRWHTRQATRRWLTAQGALAIMFAPWLLYATGFMLGHSKDWIASISVATFMQRLATAFSVGTTFPGSLGLLWALGFATLFAAGLVRAIQSRDQARSRGAIAMLGFGLAVPVVITFLVSLRRPLFDERYLIASLPIYLVLVGGGLAYVQSRWRLAHWALGGLLLVGPAIALYHYHYDTAFSKSPDWRSALDYIAERQQPGDLLILNYPDPAQEYYNAGRLPYELVPSAFPVDEAATRDALARLAAGHPRLWLVPTRADNWDRNGMAEGWLMRYADQVSETGFRGLRVQLYQTEQLYTETMESLNVTIGDGIRLRGFALLVDGQPAGEEPQARPGSTLLLKLYWGLAAPVGADYTVFTHLVAPDGTLKGQKDSPPLAGSYPTSQWQVGEALVDRFEITVDGGAPAGRYVLEAGLYLWPSLERLPIRDGAGQALGDALPLTEILIAP